KKDAAGRASPKERGGVSARGDPLEPVMPLLARWARWRRQRVLARGIGIERHAAHVGVDAQLVAERGEGALFAVGALAQSTRDAHRDRRVEVLQVEAVGINHFVRARRGASEADGVDARLRMKAV